MPTMSKEERRIEKKLYFSWGRDNPHVVQGSLPRSGRNWLSNMMQLAYGAITKDATISLASELIDVTYIMDHGPVHSISYFERNDIGDVPSLHDDTKYIILVRDPRDALLSWCHCTKKKLVHASGSTAADYWPEEFLFMKLQRWEFFLDFINEPHHLVIQYERMCLNPTIELIRMGRFLGIEPIVDLDDVVRETDLANFGSGIDRYHMQGLKHQRDPFFPKNWSGIILDYIGHTMREWGYFPEGHSASILAAL